MFRYVSCRLVLTAFVRIGPPNRNIMGVSSFLKQAFGLPLSAGFGAGCLRKLAVVPVFFWAVEAVAGDSEDLLLGRLEAVEALPGLVANSDEVAKQDEKASPARIVDFVLAEVRKQLDPNPETEIVELKIDPDFQGAEDTYLVNAVLDARGRKLSVGVMVSVAKTPEGMKASFAYVD